MPPASFCAKTSKLYYGKNLWLVGPGGIFEQILIGFFFFFFFFFFVFVF